ncbi:DUF5980 family protein [Actinoalloteichus hymeniacidonis]|uniref:Uncharacterized protein n=1 Tax=Actinoalloteichus hymeniacidonis TaxID=340345 RepID=A0AAC9HT97_9PSEU|nr:DUF5980 family protein [Actinoalloteichus hymeniacidonis]AOS64536.1 hypothetical protein TL08_18725 [Actinoalloteichus hymeniacidonis]MBB5907392.1 hypothetical protein [Actinoalloteichus hymeniacidonis]
MRAIFNVASAAVLLAAGMLVSTTPAAASTPHSTESATWTMVDADQHVCGRPSYGKPNTYVLAGVYGEWPRLNTGVRNLPAGSSSSGGIIEAGSTEGSDTTLGMVQLSLGPAPAGVYIAEVWASDGTVTQAVPLTITYREDCN